TAPVGGSLVTIDFHIEDGASAGVKSIQLVDSVNPTGRHGFTTEVSDAQGAYILNPAPSRVGSSGGISGDITILATPQPTVNVGDSTGVVLAAATGRGDGEAEATTEVSIVSSASGALRQ